jgi:hypothetical protein
LFVSFRSPRICNSQDNNISRWGGSIISRTAQVRSHQTSGLWHWLVTSLSFRLLVGTFSPCLSVTHVSRYSGLAPPLDCSIPPAAAASRAHSVNCIWAMGSRAGKHRARGPKCIGCCYHDEEVRCPATACVSLLLHDLLIVIAPIVSQRPDIGRLRLLRQRRASQG